MRALQLALLSVGCLVAFAHATSPSIPVWPDKVMVLGHQYVLSADGSVQSTGTFITEYDWTNRALRESHVSIPGGTFADFQRFFNVDAAAFDSYYNLATGNWTCYFVGELPMTPPDWMTNNCFLLSSRPEEINHQQCYKWNCPYGAINQTLWTNKQTGTIVRQYQPAIGMYPALQVDYDRFVDGTSVFADHVFPRTPILPIPAQFNCATTGASKRNTEQDAAVRRPINFLFRSPRDL